MKEKVDLFKNKDLCCGCATCAQICPRKAIEMREDEEGAIYPHIDMDKCVSCHLCEQVCTYQREKEKNYPLQAFAAALKNDEQIKASSSGGAFAALALETLRQGGVVAGCAMVNQNDSLEPEHILIEDITDLPKLQGSKYVKSDTSKIFKKVKEQLTKGRQVLFCGTPCQVDALRGFLQKKEYKNLITVDLICHGVPSTKLFKDYIEMKRDKNKTIKSFEFRDKNDGWGNFNYCMAVEKNGKKPVVQENRPSSRSSYYWSFLNGVIYRDNCYTCPYASLERVSDITLGDWWGIEKEYPELLQKNGGRFEEKRGISCILVNTEKGKQCLLNCKEELIIHETEISRVAKYNKQLGTPSKASKYRNEVMELYKNHGYKAVEKWYRKKLGAKWYLYQVWDRLPKSVTSKLK